MLRGHVCRSVTCVWRYSALALEMIMLMAFGLSWFVKGQKILAGNVGGGR
jgi:hypothetical protein